jgi:translation initiation factor IF-3
MSIARAMDLDLVEVAPDANPPVCKIMDFNRFKYETAQKAKESRRKATSTSIKEMKYRPKIGSGDFDTKTRQVARFLGEGHKVKITIMFRGREMSHPELGKKILDHVAETVGPVAKVEAEPKLDGRNMTMVLAPDRRAQHSSARPAARTPAGPEVAKPAGQPAADQQSGVTADQQSGVTADQQSGVTADQQSGAGTEAGAATEAR